MSALVGGSPTYFGSPGSNIFLSGGRGSYLSAQNIGVNDLMFYRKMFAVYLTQPVPADLTSILVGASSTSVATFTASISETGTLGTDAITVQEIFQAITAEVGIKGSDAINALEKFLSTIAEVGMNGTDAINAKETFRAALVESGASPNDAIQAIENFLASVLDIGTAGADSISGQTGALSYSAQIAEVGQSGTDAISVSSQDAPQPVIIRQSMPFGFWAANEVPQQRQRISASIDEEGQVGATSVTGIISFGSVIKEHVHSIGEESISGGRRNVKNRAVILYYRRVA